MVARELAGLAGLTNLTRRFRLSSPCALGSGEQSIHHLYECATAPGQTSRAPAGGVQVCECRVHMVAPGQQASRLAAHRACRYSVAQPAGADAPPVARIETTSLNAWTPFAQGIRRPALTIRRSVELMHVGSPGGID